MGEAFDPETYDFVNQPMRKRESVRVIDNLVQVYGAPAISLVLDAFKDLGFRFSTKAGITISKNDVVIPPDKGEILQRFEAEVAEIQDQYEQGLMDQEGRHEAVVEKWTDATEEVARAMERHFDPTNPIFMMANSGARGSFKQIRQLAGMRGLMANPKGEIIERPIKANFMEGLSVLEYFISTHGARKGLADTALRTADSGYLTRRLVDVAQDVIIREADCGTEEFIDLPVFTATGDPNDNLVGRFAAQDIKAGNKVLVGRGQEIDRAEWAAITEARRDANDKGSNPTVPVRSTLKCEAVTGVCQACYGRSLASGQVAQIGDAVGIVAAQSIGEPGTQLTMRTFHTGGVAGADITHGLPRVVELFEARKPKGVAHIAEQDGVVTIESNEKARTVVITDDAGAEHRYTFPRGRASSSRRPARGGRHAAQRGVAVSARPAQAARAGPRPSATSSRRCRRSTSPRAWTSTTSTSSSSCGRCSRRSALTRRATRPTSRGSSWTATSSPRRTTGSRPPRARRPSTRRSSSASRRPRSTRTPSCRPPPSRRRRRCSPTPRWRARRTRSTA
jgi:DNA-directed RNA polymerase subunit beta'